MGAPTAPVPVPEPTSPEAMHQLVDGCTLRRPRNEVEQEIELAYGSPRMELGNIKAGEAVCCSSDGLATRNINGQCTSGQALKQAFGQRVHLSKTFDESVAICESAGMRLCHSQNEVDTACGRGCGFDWALVWVVDRSHLAPAGAATCDVGLSPTQNDCEAVATRVLAELGKPTNRFSVVTWGFVPSGCIVWTAPTPWQIYFNKFVAGPGHQLSSVVCSS